MNILLCHNGELLGLGWRFLQDGVGQVEHFGNIPTKTFAGRPSGLLWYELIAWSDIIISSRPLGAEFQSRAQMYGKPIIGSSDFINTMDKNYLTRCLFLHACNCGFIDAKIHKSFGDLFEWHAKQTEDCILVANNAHIKLAKDSPIPWGLQDSKIAYVTFSLPEGLPINAITFFDGTEFCNQLWVQSGALTFDSVAALFTFGRQRKRLWKPFDSIAKQLARVNYRGFVRVQGFLKDQILTPVDIAFSISPVVMHAILTSIKSESWRVFKAMAGRADIQFNVTEFSVAALCKTGIDVKFLEGAPLKFVEDACSDNINLLGVRGLDLNLSSKNPYVISGDYEDVAIITGRGQSLLVAQNQLQAAGRDIEYPEMLVDINPHHHFSDFFLELKEHSHAA